MFTQSTWSLRWMRKRKNGAGIFIEFAHNIDKNSAMAMWTWCSISLSFFFCLCAHDDVKKNIFPTFFFSADTRPNYFIVTYQQNARRIFICFGRYVNKPTNVDQQQRAREREQKKKTQNALRRLLRSPTSLCCRTSLSVIPLQEKLSLLCISRRDYFVQ